MTTSDDRERPKKSWREIDAQRDRSAHTKRDDRERPEDGRRGRRSTKNYKAALDRLFETGEIASLLEEAASRGEAPSRKEGGAEGDTRARLAARVRDAFGPDEVTKAVNAYLAKYGRPPEDFEFLGPMLQHSDPSRVREAIDGIGALLDAGMKPRRPRAIAALLRTIEEVGDDRELAEKAHALWRRIG